ncbi:MAG TPA: adenylate/guanylate cyclase domain-containing protein [Steroidobacteraceae bacterium]
MVALNEKNSGASRAPLNYGIGVHVGDVMYGNIGSHTRLDFTVIGPAVNMASRLETLTKQLGRTVLLSRAFADFVESDFDLERVGEYPRLCCCRAGDWRGRNVCNFAGENAGV